jgi:Ca-activated chloride channel family protein
MAGEPLQLAKQAAQAFLRALGPDDRAMVVAIGSDVEVIAPLSSDHDAQIRAVAALDPWSTTALHDAIVGALDRLDGQTGRRALVVFSDGVDRYSETPASSVLERARNTQVLIYPITLGRERPPLAAELAVLTGGRSFLVREADALEETFTTIAGELRQQYLLGYAAPEAASPGERRWRSIRVELAGTRRGLRVRARDGYYGE